jgi:scyllo-inositol 2-dehydrogenase (NADP+)
VKAPTAGRPAQILPSGTPPPLTAPYNDPLSYFAAVVRGQIKPASLASLQVNLTVVQILDATQKSARTGKAVGL